nr:cell wall-binding repeat-containing protein [Clostridia bacterium]
ADSVPAPDAAVTVSNILALAKAYDPDAYHILNTMNSKGEDITFWFYRGSITDGIDTGTHEEFHGYTHRMGGFDYDTYSWYDLYYLGNGKTRAVPQTDVFKTETVTGSIPEKYRTFRYDTYVAPGAEPSANQIGVYGLLNEFSAYHWGLHVIERLFPYFSKYEEETDAWNTFMLSYLNNRNAYSEFYYWTLLYLDYARKNAPAVYKGIIENKAYCQTFVEMEANFRALMAKCEKDLDQVSMRYNGTPFKDNFDGKFLRLGYRSTAGCDNDYDVLMPLINSSQFDQVKKDIGLTGASPAPPVDPPVDPYDTSQDQANVVRIFGPNRYDTSLLAADALKTELGVSKFDAAVIASGENFPDALTGAYLAKVAKAPILLTSKNNPGDVIQYVRANVKPGGKVYLLGGPAMVPNEIRTNLAGYQVQRLGGANRYDTNLLILKAAGVKGGEILICAGGGFADSLSASAIGKPILIVGDKLSAEQLAYLKGLSGVKFTILGGLGSVNSNVQIQLRKLGSVIRLGGKTRFETSVIIAQHYFASRSKAAVLAYAQNFPDGLSGGPLAMAVGAPLLLVNSTEAGYQPAAAFARGAGVKTVYVLGGPAVISSAAANAMLK